MVLAIEPAWTVENRRVEFGWVVGCCQHDDAVVRLEAVEFVQKERTALVVDHRVEVLEHDDAWRHACAIEDLRHVLLFRSAFRLEAPHVEAWFAELVDQRLERVGLSVSGWANEDGPAFPRYSVTLVDLA